MLNLGKQKSNGDNFDMADFYGSLWADNLNGSSSSDRIYSYSGNDTLRGWQGNDLLDGGIGNDLLEGGDGNDTLIGTSNIWSPWADVDTLRGGNGADTFVLGDRSNVFYQGSSWAYIMDFNGRSDYIQLQGNASQYQLQRRNEQGIGNPNIPDTAIVRNGDVLGVLIDNTDISFNATSTRQDFKFV